MGFGSPHTLSEVRVGAAGRVRVAGRVGAADRSGVGVGVEVRVRVAVGVAAHLEAAQPLEPLLTY